MNEIVQHTTKQNIRPEYQLSGHQINGIVSAAIYDCIQIINTDFDTMPTDISTLINNREEADLNISMLGSPKETPEFLSEFIKEWK